MQIQENLEVPIDDTDAYIADYTIDDECDEKEPRFAVIWTSKKLKARIGNKMTQDDATYRLTWQGYPFFVSGRSSSTGRFFPSHVTLASHEDTEAWKSSYNFVKTIAVPR